MNDNPRVNGKQLTVIVVAICTAVVLAPVGVFAAAHSSFSIADGKHPSRTAAVSKTGALSVAGTVKVSGTPKVSLSGTPKVSLNGTTAVSLAGTPTVKTEPGLLGTPYSLLFVSASATPDTIPAGKTFVITTISGSDTVPTGAAPFDDLSLSGTPYSDSGVMIPLTYQKPESVSDDLWSGTEDVDIPVPSTATIALTSSPTTGPNIPRILVAGYLV